MRPTLTLRRLRVPVTLVGLVLADLGSPSEVRADDFGAKTNGNWNSQSTWTSTAVPGAGDNVYIGSTYPVGATANATVILTQNQQAASVFLGYGPGTSGTLNLGNFNLTASALYLGFNGGTGAVTRGTGSLNLGYLQLSASSLVLGSGDKTMDLLLSNGSSVTTAASGNVSDTVVVHSGATLTLGADLSSGANTNAYAIEVSGVNSTLNAQFHKITTDSLSIGWEYGSQGRVPGTNVVHFVNRGDLIVNALFVANQNFNLTATDQVTSLSLANGSTTFAPSTTVGLLDLFNGATATTTAVGNIPGFIMVMSGSTLTLGADLIAGGNVSGDNSTLDAQGHKITTSFLSIGWDGGNNVRFLNRGELAVTTLLVANQNLNLTATDQVTDFSLSHGSTNLIAATALQNLNLSNGATAATSATGNITQGVVVSGGSTLTLGADLSVSGTVQLSGDNSTLNAQGHTITADTLRIAWDGGTNVQLLNRGNLAVTNLFVANQTFNLIAGDQVANFNLSNGSTNLGTAAGIQSLSLQGSSATTASSGNLTGNVDVTVGSTVTLGADLTVSGYVNAAGDNSTIDAQFHKITADTLYLGYNGGTNVRLLNKGELAVTKLYVYNQTQNLSFGAIDRVANLTLYNAAASTAATGNLTGSVWITNGSTLTLGADLTVTGFIQVDGGYFNDTLNAQGHKITADTLTFGYQGSNGRLLNRGTLSVTNLQVANQDFNLTATDQVANFYLSYGKTTLGAGVVVQHLSVWDQATATTSTTGNITQSVEVNNVLPGGSKLTLGADLILSGSVTANGHTITIDAQGHNITANSLSLKYTSSSGDPNIQLLNDGAITVGGTLALAGGVQVQLHGGNDTAQSLHLSETSGLRIKSAATGFTIGGTSASDLLFDGTSTLTLEMNGSQPGWLLRWANPTGGNHIADLNAFISQHKILIDATSGGQLNIVSQNGYTYIVQPVPEPVLIFLVAAPVAVGLYRRHGHGRFPTIESVGVTSAT
jgi:hypothetical protein